MAAPSLAFACASNDARILRENLARSPALADGRHRLQVVENAASAAQAYNAVLDAATEDVVVFAHHDVYLPEGWDALLAARVAEVAAQDPGWGVLGAFGVGFDARNRGVVWSSSIGFIAGVMPTMPVPVQSFDELLLVVRRGSGLRFDPGLPGFHMYGTDIACQARAQGLGAYAVALPTIHNDGYKEALGDDFAAAFDRVRRRWARFLPIKTPVIKVTHSRRDLYKWRWRMWRSRAARRAAAAPDARDPRDYARLCGWMDLRANPGAQAAEPAAPAAPVRDRNTS